MIRALMLASLLLVSIGAASAQADRRDPVPFDLFSGTTQTEGRAKAKGKIRFLDNGRLRVKGYINDICPGDGHAAVLDVEVSYNDVTRTIRRRTHGLCHELKRDFDFKTRVFEHVSQVAVIAKEIRFSENGIAEAYGDCDGLIIFMPQGYGDACAP